MDNTNWYYSNGDQPVGPVSFDVLRQWAAAGQLAPTHQLWQDGATEWVTAATVPGLFAGAVPPATSSFPETIRAKPADAKGRGRAEQAAKASWMAPIIAVALNGAANASRTGRHVERTELLAVGLASFLLYVLGLIAGIYALTQVRRFGPRGIRAGALTGTIINSIIIVIFIAAITVAAMMNPR